MGILSKYAPFLVNTVSGALRNLSVVGEYDGPRSSFIILNRGIEWADGTRRSGLLEIDPLVSRV